MITSAEFMDFVSRRIVSLDEQILETMPTARVEEYIPSWWKRRESVRRIAEGLGYQPSEPVVETRTIEDGWIGHVQMGRFPESDSLQHTWERFEKIHVDAPPFKD